MEDTLINELSEMVEQSEKDKMLGGKLYRAFTKELTEERAACRRLLRQFNNLDDEEDRAGDRRSGSVGQRTAPTYSASDVPPVLSGAGILKKLLGSFDGQHPCYIEPPFQCDYV
jgi:Maltose acetyltransferase